MTTEIMLRVMIMVFLVFNTILNICAIIKLKEITKEMDEQHKLKKDRTKDNQKGE